MRKSLISLWLILFLAGCVTTIIPNESSHAGIQIHDIQGCVQRSPMEGKKVEDVEGIVTWKKDNGFFMQGETPDDRPCSSEGIFIFTDQYPDVLPADKVSVAGKVQEFAKGDAKNQSLTVTEITSSSIKILSSNNDLPKPLNLGDLSIPNSIIDDDRLTVFDPEQDGIDFWESLEGMLVQLNSAVVVGPRNQYNEVVVLPASQQEDNLLSKEGALLQTATDNNPERIIVDLPSSYEKSVNVGATFSSPLIGVIDYAYETYHLIEINTPQIENTETNTEILARAGVGVLRIATYNVENLNRFDNTRMKKIARQIAKNMSSPAILILEEMQDDSGTEDDGTTSAKENLATLVKQIRDQNGADYAFIDPEIKDGQTGGINGGNIRTVALYRKENGLDLVSKNLDWVHYDESVFIGNRQPLLLKFTYQGSSIYLIGVHLVSNNLNSPLYGAIQPISKPEEDKRINQSKQIASISDQIQKKDPDAPILIMGDFNDTSYSKAVSQLLAVGYSEPFTSLAENERYSILYEGNAQLFDHVLLNPAAVKLIQNEWILHINSGSSVTNQVSDHDPAGVDLQIK